MNDSPRTESPWRGALTAFLVTALFFFPYIFIMAGGYGNQRIHPVHYYLLPTAYTALFLLNYFLLVPDTIAGKINHRHATLRFVIVNVICILLLCSLILWMQRIMPPPRFGPKGMPRGKSPAVPMHLITRDATMMILSIALAYALRLGEVRASLRQRKMQVETQARALELRTLKAQLNPHFLFNTLNNIYALIAFNPDKAQKAVHDLSSMLRYLIYDTGNASAPLSQEIRFIDDYIQLARLRLPRDFNLSVKLPAAPPGADVAPLMFLTIVENAFKHCATQTPGAFIRIEITAATTPQGDVAVTLLAANSYSPGTQESTQHRGVGLANIRQQLALLYPDTPQPLETDADAEKGVFTARLNLLFPASHD